MMLQGLRGLLGELEEGIREVMQPANPMITWIQHCVPRVSNLTLLFHHPERYVTLVPIVQWNLKASPIVKPWANDDGVYLTSST